MVFLKHNKFRRFRWDQRPFDESSAGYDFHCNTSNQAVPANNFHHHFLRFALLMLLLIPASNFHHHFLFNFYSCSCWFFSEIFVIWLLRMQQNFSTQIPPLATLTSSSSSLTTIISLQYLSFCQEFLLFGEISLRFLFNRLAMTELGKDRANRF